MATIEKNKELNLNCLEKVKERTKPSKYTLKFSMKEDIVVTGISGKYPESDNIEEFAFNLYNNIDVVIEDDRRWPKDFYGLPISSGKLKEVDKFDAKYFEVEEEEANHMDSQIRIMLELTYEALWDSGTDPSSLIGSNTGVFVATSYDEYLCAYSRYPDSIKYIQYFAQQISYKFNLKGPSIVLDAACASSLLALHEAVTAIRNNCCDNAVVVGVNICFNPLSELHFYKMNMLSAQGKCMCLDESADGYAKGEACVVVFLQKRSVAKRIYATIIHTKTNNDGYEVMGITYPSWTTQKSCMRDTYLESGIDPLDVQYVETHLTGTKVGDPQEMLAILQSMCKGRKVPILIGALKSNIGHTEAASGLCAISKVILSFENECIPANLHFNKPNPQIEGLMSGILKPINQNTPFYGDLVALNNFGFGGSNVHVIVKSTKIISKENNNRISEGIPRLIQMCGRNEDSINHFFTSLLNNPKKVTRDVLALINDISKTSPFQMNSGLIGMRFRGYTIINKSDENSIISTNPEINKVSKMKKEIWFVFSGIGTQWSAMAKSLMNIEIFAKSISISSDILRKYEIDLWKLLTDDNENIADSTLHSFITIAAIQIAFVDLLNELDIKADGIIGHSIGELICAYADGCISAEETILIAYWRGKLIEDNIEKNGMMAAVGMGWDEIQLRCPDRVFLACHNSEDSVTISGDKNLIKSFMTHLKKDNIFTSKVKSTGIAFHCPLIYRITKQLHNKLKDIITSNRPISSKWFSTTYSHMEFANKEIKYLTAQYFVDNLLFPVLFNEVLKQISKNAIIIEISPHHLLQSVIKRGLGSEVTYLPLMKRNSDNINLLLTSIGTLYIHGLNPKIEKLYPKVNYPVSNGTRFISPLIKWDHKQSLKTIKYPEFFNLIERRIKGFSVNLMDEEDNYISGHKIDGKILFPATGYLMLAWKRLAEEQNTTYDEIAVEFRNVVLHRATLIPNKGEIIFNTNFDEKSGKFIISESKTIVVTGKIFALNAKQSLKFEYLIEENSENNYSKTESILMNRKDIYKELRLRGYDYGKSFQCISSAYQDNRKLKAEIEWSDNWVTFADCMFQISLLCKHVGGLFVPIRIDTLRCDPKVLLAEAKASGNGNKVHAIFDNDLGIGVTKGLEYHGVKPSVLHRNLNLQKPVVGNYRFISYDEDICYDNEMHLLHYSKACDRLAAYIMRNNHILFGFEPQTEKRVDFQNSDDSSHHENDKFIHIEKRDLHRFLTEFIQHDFENDVNSNEYNLKLSDLEKDLITESYNNQQFLESLLGIVQENKITSDLQVLEISQISSIIYFNVIKIFELYDHELKINYSLLHPSPDELPSDILNKFNSNKWDVKSSHIPKSIVGMDLIIYKDKSVSQLSFKSSVDLKTILGSIWDTLNPSGFALIICRDGLTFAEQVICKILRSKNFYGSRKKKIIFEAQKIGFVLIGTCKDLFQANSLLFRKITTDIKLEKQVFISISDELELWIEKLQTQLKSIHLKPEGENIWLIANDKPTNGIIGLYNCLRKETNGKRIRCFFNLNGTVNEVLAEEKSKLNVDLESIVKKDLTINIWNNEKFGYFKLCKVDSIVKRKETEYCYLNVRTRGDLSSFEWFESQHKYWPICRQNNQILCHVYYAALNFRDIMLSTGRLPADALPYDMALQDCILGMEFSGIDENGNKVMGIIPSKALATTCVVEDIKFLFSIPQHWSMEDAATVPVAYVTGYYALIVRGHLKRGEKVLIHSGSGAVGQAAINICLSLNCQIFITVGSDAKREFLKKLFPVLSDRNFSSSHDLSFKTYVMNETNGSGVDVILNSLSEEKLKASLECLANNGRFLEIGKYDLSKNNKLDISELLSNKTFHGILLDSLVGADNSPKIISKESLLLRELFEKGIINGTVKPLNRTVFNIDKSEEAFRYMASGKHMGKVIIKIRDQQNGNMLSKPPRILAIPRTVFYPNKSYIITGGLGGMGLELINWMIERGAKQFVITSRTGPEEPYQYIRLKYFAEKGANVIISTEDISKLKCAQNLLSKASNMAPIGGIFHLSMILSDALFENQTIESFKKVCSPKSDVLKNLDMITREFYRDIDFFVAYSSGIASGGNSGQTNYGYSNSIMDRICELRRNDGFHALAIHWGPIGDVGFVAENMFDSGGIVLGLMSQRMNSVLTTLDSLLQSEHPIVFSFVKAGPKFDTNHVKTDLIKRVAYILGVEDFSKLDPNTKLVKLGMDSFMAVEIKQAIDRDFGLDLSTQDIRDLTINKVKEINSLNQSSVNGKVLNSDEKQATKQSLIRIPTENFSPLNGITEGKIIFFLPPIDGTYDLFNPIAKYLNRPVIGINWTVDCLLLKSVEETANYFLYLIIENFPNNDFNYDLIGYSFGGVIAYEMCLQLQYKWNRFVKLILLDSSPIQLKLDYIEILELFKDKSIDEENVLDNILIDFLKDNVSIEMKDIQSLLSKTLKEEKIKKVSEMFIDLSGVKENEKVVEFAMESYSTKILMLINNTTEFAKLNGDILLIRAKEHMIDNPRPEYSVKHDYGLNEIITGKCEVVIFDGSHHTYLIDNCHQIGKLITENMQIQ